MLLVLSERSPERPLWRKGLHLKWSLLAVLVPTLLSLIAALYVPPLASLLGLAPLSLADWPLVVVAAGITTLWRELLKGRSRGRA
jgi:hypothetical protein